MNPLDAKVFLVLSHAMSVNVSAIELLDILQLAKLDEPKAKAIVRAIEISTENHEQSLREYMENDLMRKIDHRLVEQENRMIKWMFSLLVSQAVLVLGGVCFLTYMAGR